MAKYECKVCGYIYNEQHAGRSFEELTECPICNESKENFIALDSEGVPVEQKPAETFFEDKVEAVADTVATEEVVEETVADAVEDIKAVAEDIPHIVEEKSEVPEFVVERRQEFWSPIGSRQETIIADAEEKEEEVKEEVVEEVVDSSFASRIESFYSSAEPVGMAHIISDEDEKEFKPLWNSAGGTVQRVIDPFGDRSEPVVKAENVGMVMPAEEPTVEEILGEEPEMVEEVNEGATKIAEDVFFAEEDEAVAVVEEAVSEAAEEVVEETVEEVIPEVVEEAIPETVEEIIPEVKEDAMEEAPEIVEDVVAEESAVTNNASAEYFLDEEDDDDFFSEVVMDHFMEETPVAEEVVEAVVEAPVAEEVVEEAIEAPVAEEIVEEVVEALAAEEIVEEVVEAPVAEEIVEAVVEAPAAEEIVEETVEAPAVEEIVEEAVEAPAAEEIVEETVEAPAAEEIVEETVEAPVAEEIVEETVEAPVVEEVVEEAPRIKAWSFLDDVLEAGTVVGAGVAGAAVVSAVAEEKEETSEAIEEVKEETEVAEEADVVEKDTIDSYDYFTEEIRRAREVGGYTPLRVGEIDLSEKYEEEVEEEAEEVVEELVEEVVEEVVAEPEKEVKEYCNNLEKILILPAQLNPMPLPEAVEVDGRTVVGIGSDRPLVLDNPVFSTGAYNMVQYIPNSGLTSEDYQKADAIEIVVGKGNGIEKNINSKEDLRQVVNFLRLESDGCPIGIKLGAGRIERDLEFCIFAKPDYVVLNNFSVVPLPYALHRATKYLNTVQSDIDIVIALDGVKDAEELAKIIAMGADVIALRKQPSNLDEMIAELKNHARVTGHYEVQDLNVKDLCTIDREIAEYTDIYHV